MKITPVSDREIKIETEKGTFSVYALVEGGLSVCIPDGYPMIVEGTGKSPITDAVFVHIKEGERIKESGT
jgi:hypothetical protein